jgi:hypothetical protein
MRRKTNTRLLIAIATIGLLLLLAACSKATTAQGSVASPAAPSMAPTSPSVEAMTVPRLEGTFSVDVKVSKQVGLEGKIPPGTGTAVFTPSCDTGSCSTEVKWTPSTDATPPYTTTADIVGDQYVYESPNVPTCGSLEFAQTSHPVVISPQVDASGTVTGFTGVGKTKASKPIPKNGKTCVTKRILVITQLTGRPA